VPEKLLLLLPYGQSTFARSAFTLIASTAPSAFMGKSQQYSHILSTRSKKKTGDLSPALCEIHLRSSNQLRASWRQGKTHLSDDKSSFG